MGGIFKFYSTIYGDIMFKFSPFSLFFSFPDPELVVSDPANMKKHTKNYQFEFTFFTLTVQKDWWFSFKSEILFDQNNRGSDPDSKLVKIVAGS